MVSKSRSELYGQLRTGARVHSRAVKLFGEAPEKPVARLFREAVSGERLTRNQRRYLLDTLKRLKENYALVEAIDKDTSAQEVLSMCLQGVGLPPRAVSAPVSDARIKEILEASKGKTGLIAVSAEQLGPKKSRDAFGLVLTVDNPIFERLTNRLKELGRLPRERFGAYSTPLAAMDPKTGQITRVSLTIMPERPTTPAPKEEVDAHERIHRESWALGLRRKQLFGPPKTTEEARDWLHSSLMHEFIADAHDAQMLRYFMRSFFAENRRLIASTLSIEELRNIQAIPDLLERSAKKIPREELVAIIRTTPIARLHRMLEGVLKHT
jgi:hypothetical protein